MSAATGVAIVGAGPYGLSVAAHLAARRIPTRVFGEPMETWRKGMPGGMLLKSEGFASSLSDPEDAFTLGAFCRERGLPYEDIGWPVPVEVFAAYGEEFQRRLVPQLERRDVARIERTTDGFTLELADGGVAAARNVVLATGIGHFGQIPPALEGLPKSLLTHSSQNADYARFAGRDVVVIGAGASALDAAAALRRAGAGATLVSRRSAVRFYAAGARRRLLDALRAPMTPLGPGWKKLLCVKAPLVFHRMPERFRTEVVRRYLGPAPGWFVRDTVEGHVPFLLESTVAAARVVDGRVELTVERVGAPPKHIVADHVVAATGYRVDVRRLAFLSEGLRHALRAVDGSPALTSHFESSVPGLYFVGTPSAYSFGPMLRFVCGAEFAARRLTRRLNAVERRVASGRPSDVPLPRPAWAPGARGSAGP